MMLLSIFSAMYELIIGINPDEPSFRDNLFNSIGITSFIVSVVICMIFYLGLGRWKDIWYTNFHWAVTIGIVAIIGFAIAFIPSKDHIGIVDGYMIQFAIINAVYSVLYFALFSFLFKKFSIYSKRTPI